MDKIAQLEHEIEVLKLKKQVAELQRDIAELQARPHFAPVVIQSPPYVLPYPYTVPWRQYQPIWYENITVTPTGISSTAADTTGISWQTNNTAIVRDNYSVEG